MSPAASQAEPRVLVILPCFNESPSIGTMLAEIRSLGERYHTIVVDDGSSDGTYEAASTLSPCVRLPVNLGIGGAVQTGLKYGRDHQYDLCIQVDGDGQHPAKEIQRLVDGYRTTRANIVLGSRFLDESSFRSTLLRRVGIALIGFALRLTCGQRIADPTSGFRLLDRRAVELFSREYPLDFPEPISLAVGLRHGLEVHEVPVVMREREHGRSSIAGLDTVAYVIRVVAYIIFARLGR